MIKAKAAILKSLGNWTYDEISIPDPGKDRAIIKIIKSGICSTDVVRSMEKGFYSYPIVPGHEMLGYVYKLGSQNNSLKQIMRYKQYKMPLSYIRNKGFNSTSCKNLTISEIIFEFF